MKKTTAIAALAVSGALLLSACGGSDVSDVEMPEPTATEETTETKDPDAPTVVEENLLPTNEVKDVDEENIAINVGDSVQVAIEPWFPTCESELPEYVENPETGVVEVVGGYFPQDSFVKEFDTAYLVEPIADEGEDVVFNEDGTVDIEGTFGDEDPVVEEAPNTSESGQLVLLNGESDSRFVLNAQKAGTTDLRVAYSCEPTGDSFDKTWTIKINP
jgi:hypothetical protein